MICSDRTIIPGRRSRNKGLQSGRSRQSRNPFEYHFGGLHSATQDLLLPPCGPSPRTDIGPRQMNNVIRLVNCLDTFWLRSTQNRHVISRFPQLFAEVPAYQTRSAADDNVHLFALTLNDFLKITSY